MKPLLLRVSLACAAVLVGAYVLVSYSMERQIESQGHVVLTLVESGLGEHPFAPQSQSASRYQVDELAIGDWIDAANAHLAAATLGGSWVVVATSLQILDIDGVGPFSQGFSLLAPATGAKQQVALVERQGIEREILWSTTLTISWWRLVLLMLVLLTVLGLLHRVMPVPLTPEEGAWYTRFIDTGLASPEAESATREQATLPMLSDVQLTVIFQYADTRGIPLLEAIRKFRSLGIAGLSSEQSQWLAIALINGLNDDEAKRVAGSPDGINIQLESGEINIHGLKVKMTSTPLLYYAFYAQARQSGEGWVQNPPDKPSSTPDDHRAALQGLYNSMDPHARAAEPWADQQYVSKVFAKKRNEASNAIEVAIGTFGHLAKPYLFETRPGKLGRSEVRIPLDSDLIRIS